VAGGAVFAAALPPHEHSVADHTHLAVRGKLPDFGVEEFQLAGLDKTVWQYFTVVPDFQSVGVRDNARTFEYPVILRAVNTIDAMTASIEELPWPILHKITNRILNEVKGVNRVLYDLSPKPNATIEWE